MLCADGPIWAQMVHIAAKHIWFHSPAEMSDYPEIFAHGSVPPPPPWDFNDSANGPNTANRRSAVQRIQWTIRRPYDGTLYVNSDLYSEKDIFGDKEDYQEGDKALTGLIFLVNKA